MILYVKCGTAKECGERDRRVVLLSTMGVFVWLEKKGLK